MSEFGATPNGTLALQTITMPADTNPFGDVFGGWVMGQMDIAGAVHAKDVERARMKDIILRAK